MITSFSGQTGINIREHLESESRRAISSFNFLGADLDTLDCVEDRNRFDSLVKDTDLTFNPSYEVKGYKSLLNTISETGYPVIIRPSYVIGGESMYIFRSFEDIERLPQESKKLIHDNSVTFQVERYIENALEYDVDLVRDRDGNCIFSVCEHIEYAGVHSGDSGMISPPVKIEEENLKKMKKIACDLASKLEITGPINFQFAVTGRDIFCIEANPRGSRTLPFLSKAYDIDLPGEATNALLGHSIKQRLDSDLDFYIVKQSTFPFDRFLEDNIILGPKMRSTGETLGIDKSLDMAIMKSYLGNYPKLKDKGEILFSLSNETKEIVLPYLSDLKELGFTFIATKGTAKFIEDNGFKCMTTSKLGKTNEETSMLSTIKSKNLITVLNTPYSGDKAQTDGEYIRNNSISYGVSCFTRVENIQSVLSSIIYYHKSELTPISLQEIING